jgi:hypothetical protein
MLEIVRHEAAQEMRVGPSEPACRSRLQTTLSCIGKISEMASKLRYLEILRISSEGACYCLGGVRHRDGMNLILAFERNVGTCRFDVKGEIQVENPRE